MLFLIALLLPILSFSLYYTKVGHALRDRSPNVDLHIQRNLKTRAQLAEEGIDIVQYAESVTGGVDHDQWRSERYYKGAENAFVKHRQLFVRPPGYVPACSPHGAELAASSTLIKMLSAPPKRTPKKKKEKELAVKKEKKAKPSKRKDGAEGSMKPAAGIPGRYTKTVNEIVVPTLQCASAELPIGGNWKFFPMPGLKNEIDLGTTLKGWTLKLEPMGFEGEPISLDVPLG